MSKASTVSKKVTSQVYLVNTAKLMPEFTAQLKCCFGARGEILNASIVALTRHPRLRLHDHSMNLAGRREPARQSERDRSDL